MLKPSAEPMIRLRGVRHNNLKNFDLDLPLHRLIVITGLSGSGKSSLAFDTLFAEGQRRYIETFSPYARQFFDRMDKPQVDSIEGIPPAIAVEQRNAVRTTRSTVGTMTEICDYVKVLWPHIAKLHCRQCGHPVRKDSPQQIWAEIASSSSSSPLPVAKPREAGTSKTGLAGKQDEDGRRAELAEILITFDLPLSEKLSLQESLALISKQGYQRLWLDGQIVRLDEATPGIQHLASRIRHLTVIQDRLRLTAAHRSRFIEACEQAYHFGKGKLAVRELSVDRRGSRNRTKDGEERESGSDFALRTAHFFSNRLHCANCDIEYREPTPALFSFNHPVGACPTCRGFGRIISIDYNLALPDRSKTLAEGVVKPWQSGHGVECQTDLLRMCRPLGVPTDIPFERLARKWQKLVIEGEPDYGTDEEHEWPRAWYGVKGYFRWLESKAYKMHIRVLLSRYRAYTACPDCGGARFQPETLQYRFAHDDLRSTSKRAGRRVRLKAGRSIVNGTSEITLADFYSLPIRDALALIDRLAKSRILRPASQIRTDPIDLVLTEIRSRLSYLNEVGLGYLTLDRPTRSLSGGETERVNLTTCLGTRLVNTLFVLDEPSVGLHPRDTDRLVRILQELRNAGNAVVVVEHEASVMRAADQIVDLGPGRGAAGGQVVFQGPYPAILKSDASLTGQYLSGRKRIEIPERRPISLESRPGAGGTELPTRTLRISHATRHNLKDLTVELPLGRFVCVTGVSGSGKSTLLREVLWPALEANLKSHIPDSASLPTKASERIEDPPSQRFGTTGDDEDESDSSTLDSLAGRSDAKSARPSTHLDGWENLGRVVLVDQSILGKTPRSNPAVYIGAFEEIREFYAQSEPARQRGLNASAFSFNSGQGQCERCRGAGFEKIEMQFLSDVFVRCPDCNGRRYRQHILEVRVERREPSVQSRGSSVQSGTGPSKLSTLDARPATASWSIADMLEATVDEVVEFLDLFPESRPARRAVERLKLLQEVGLGYLRVGQPVNTLSGGENQRLKLVRHLAEQTVERRASSVERGTAPGARPSTLDSRPVLFLFDEPTTGLHVDDVRILLQVFQRLVNAGHSVLVIEHNLEVMKTADWIVDLGPGAGDEGGRIVAQGTPETIAGCEASHTGHFLREVLGQGSRVERREPDGRRSQSLSTLDPRLSTAILVQGAREHNLKNLSLAIPREKFVVVTGVSGSGKSTLAFDLLFAEGQRRFLDSMNVYARQFVEQLSRPEVDRIAGIPPTVSIEQRNSRGGGKSTVATVTEVHHFIRLLFARLGTQFCPGCQVPVEAQTRDEVARRLRRESEQRGDLLLLAPVVKNRKGFHTDVAQWAARHGYREVRADGKMYATDGPLRLDRFREHNVEIVMGALPGRTAGPRCCAAKTPGNDKDARQRVPAALIDEALRLGQGTVFALDQRGRLSIHSTERSCPKCGRSLEPLDPKHFSYNSPQGWCPRCRGFGELFYMPEGVDRGTREDAIAESWYDWQEGRREVCPDCRGSRLNPIARAVRLRISNSSGLSMESLAQMSAAEAGKLFAEMQFKGRALAVARDLLPEIRERLKFLDEVGLGYLQLGRGVPTLSGGESRRIRLAAQLGSNLSGVLYILDEPTIGLHARDNEQLLATLQKLRARGNSVLVVEHDEATMRHADYIIDLGPGAGVHGGEVVAAGTLSQLLRHPESITGQCLRAHKTYPARGQRRLIVPVAADTRGLSRKSRVQDPEFGVEPGFVTPAAANRWLTLRHASKHNLQNITARFPLERLVCVTGVSGSGKSTLVRECLVRALQNRLEAERASSPAPFAQMPAVSAAAPSGEITGHDSLKAVYEVDQSPIGRTPRSVPATYVGFFDEIRRLFAQVPEARLRGYAPGRFSFNSPQGRCPECEGAGQIKLEMNFLPPAFVRCESCGGLRFNRETLDIEYRGRNIAQVLELPVEEALNFFASLPKVRRALQALADTGLGYLKLGQTSPTLSGGEAQRVKLVSHLLAGLAEVRTENDEVRASGPRKRSHLAPRTANLFILEEPTIGLHMADVRRLVDVLQRLVDAGHSVIVIEHNLDLVAEADWIIDLGPGGGGAGGRIVAEGTPEQIARNPRSHTGRFLRRLVRAAR